MRTVKRYNVFNNIHKALRSMLFDLQSKIQQTDFTELKADKVIAEMERVLYFYDEHADHEDRFILAHIVHQEPQLTEELEKDHVIDHNLSADLRQFISNWRQAKSVEEKELSGKQIFYALNEFIAFNLYHMNKEENQLLLALWKHFSDKEILRMEQQIMASIDPQVLMEESRWMMRSINNAEILEWMDGIKVSAPAPVYEVFLQMAADELPQVRFRELKFN
ncbi:hypothetical protein AHMF7605_28750 [Adhaeribacter arboris]|uniref:Hemerythrin-like domain-containing protein n=1 Tax=Adhaeribacter arboris TaxID=2072846 RepID=A0A2T2Y8P9_9BACT|nr:hemerythrin domain-containing protein [Adhaeribacter arboris]PSR51901.1 hypothetical protein AHMF7605_28750 [Adhaeribacter arboris]